MKRDELGVILFLIAIPWTIAGAICMGVGFKIEFDALWLLGIPTLLIGISLFIGGGLLTAD